MAESEDELRDFVENPQRKEVRERLNRRSHQPIGDTSAPLLNLIFKPRISRIHTDVKDSAEMHGQRPAELTGRLPEPWNDFHPCHPRYPWFR